MSAADVLEVATPSWKRKGLRSANDLVDFSAAAVVDDGFAAIVSSDFVAASFTVVVVVVLLVLRLMPIGDRPIC